MTAFGRHGQPADIADAVALFASSDGRWVSGERAERSVARWHRAAECLARGDHEARRQVGPWREPCTRGMSKRLFRRCTVRNTPKREGPSMLIRAGYEI